MLPYKEVVLHCTTIFRKANWYTTNNNRLLSVYYGIRLNALSRKYLFQIPYPVKIGKGLCIVHFGRIIIAPQVRIGDNCNIFTGVTIGSTVRGDKAGVPTIGNNV